MYAKKSCDFIDVQLGQTLWWEFDVGFIVPVKVVAMINYLVPSFELATKYGLGFHKENMPMGILHYKQEDNVEYFDASGPEKDDKGWSKPVELSLSPEEIASCQWASQFVWVDEPVGHSLSLEGDLYLTVEEAVRFARKSFPRLRNRAHKKLEKWRKESKDFIAGTHIRSGSPRPLFPIYLPKDVIVKR